jgi:geranylgeranyl pyrophosphate synthase
MVLGQSLDMAWTGRKGYDKRVLDAIHTGKTGALIGAACAVGAIAAGAQAADVHNWRSFGILTGLAFQAVDDTLDKQAGTGKTSGKDDAQRKLTYLTFYNSDLVRQMAMEYTGNAAKLIPASCEKKWILDFVESLVYRGK